MKKVISVFCTLCIIISFAFSNMTVFAADTEKKAESRISDNVKVFQPGSHGYQTVNEDMTFIFKAGTHNIRPSSAERNAIDVKAGVSLYIVLENNASVTAQSLAGGRAGIHLPKTSRLYVSGKGTLNAIGGDGVAAQPGEKGKDFRNEYVNPHLIDFKGEVKRGFIAEGPHRQDNRKYPDIYINNWDVADLSWMHWWAFAGARSAGGNGGTAPGAGIGGNGGKGGVFDKGETQVSYGGWDIGTNQFMKPYDYGPGNVIQEDTSWTGHSGFAANPSNNPGKNGEGAGDVYVHGDVTVNATAGQLKTGSHAKLTGGKAYGYKHVAVSGGGAAGGGGEAYGSSGIGGTGGGGGHGGGGGSGADVNSSKEDRRGSAGGGGGGGGGGSTPGLAGDMGDGAWSHYHESVATDGRSDGTPGEGGKTGTNYYHTGGYGSNGSAAGGPGQGGKIYTDNLARVNINNSLTTNSNGGVSVYTNRNVVFLDDYDVKLTQTDFTYDGKAKTPSVSITRKSDGANVPSVLGQHYSVSYENNINAGKATVILRSIGDIANTMNYLEMGSKNEYRFTFDIKKADNNNITLTTDRDIAPTMVYGSDMNVTLNDRHPNNDGVMNWSVHTDSTAKAKLVEVSKDVYQVIPTQVGKLIINLDIPESTNFNAATTKSKEIIVTPYDITTGNDIAIPNLGDHMYTGINIEPEFGKNGIDDIKFTNNKDLDHVNLVKGTDVEYSYGDETTNLNAQSIAKMKVKGIGNYIGERDLEFPIIPRPIDDMTITMSDIDFTGKTLNPLPTVKIGENDIPYVKDTGAYTLTWATKDDGPDLVNVGEKKVTVEGTGNIYGTKVLDFNINRTEIGNVVTKEAAKDVFFNGLMENNESRAKFSYFDEELSEDISGLGTINNPDDYSLEFSNHSYANEATVKVTGINNFKGEMTYNYDVLKRPLYILPDTNQWKYYGTIDKFGPKQDQDHPTFTQHIKKLNSDGSVEESENVGEFVENFKPSLEGELTRELGEALANYKFQMGGLKLADDTATANINRNYELKLIDNTNLFNIRELEIGGLQTTLQGIKGRDDWFKEEKVKVEAPEGFEISKSNSLGLDNEWKDYITFEDGDYTLSPVSFFLKRKSDNAITSVMTQKYKQDSTKPITTLRLNEDAWNKVKNNPLFEYFTNSDKTGEMFGRDDTSGIYRYHWYLSDTSLTPEELDAIELPLDPDDVETPTEDDTDIKTKEIGDKKWIEGDKFELLIDELNGKRGVVYGRSEDTAGNVFYIGSDGIVFDKDKPLLVAEYKENNTWTKDPNVKITGNILDKNAGLKDRYVAYEIAGEAMRMLDVDINGNFEINNLRDGNYDLTISAWDNADNQADPITFKVLKDTVVPKVVLSGNTTGILAREEIKFTNEIGASGVKKLEMKFNDGNWEEIPTKFDEKIFADKNGTYTFRITNGLDVVSEEASITFTRIDTKKPKLNIETLDESGKNVEALSDGSYLASHNLQVILNNLEVNKGETTFSYKKSGDVDFTLLKTFYGSTVAMPLIQDEGEHTYTLKITAGNGLSDEKTITYRIDKTKPTGVITFEKDTTYSLLNTLTLGLFFNENQKVNISTEDPTGTGVPSGISKVENFVYGGTTSKINAAPRGDEDKAIEYLVKNNGGWIEGDTTYIRDDKAYVVYYKVTDKAGNISYVRSDEITMNRVAPIIEIDYDQKGKEWDDSISIPVHVKDTNPGVEKVSYKVKNDVGAFVQDKDDASEDFVIDGLIDGIYHIEIQAIDKSQNKSVETLDIKQDGGKPTITATADNTSYDNVSMDVVIDAEYTGPSGLGQIKVSKNGEDFIDITSQIVGGKYTINENGRYIFRAYTKAGGFADATVDIDKFTAVNVTAKVDAKTSDKEIYESDTWTNQDVHIDFSNTISHLKGLKHYIKDATHADWTEVNAINGKVSYDFNAAGEYEVSYKVSLSDGSKESTPVSYKIKIDKTSPTVTIKISDKEFDGIWNALTLGAYFNKKEVATLIAKDPTPYASGIKSVEYYYDKTKNLPDVLEGNTDASKVEAAVNGRWEKGNQVVLSPNETYVVFGKVIDNAGSVTYVSSDGVVFDDINPQLTTDIDQVNWYIEQNKDIHFEASDNLSEVDSATYQVNSKPKVQASITYGEFTLNTNDLDEGINDITMEIKDKSGNVLNKSYQVKKDTTLPTVSVQDITNDSGPVLARTIKMTPTLGASGISKVEVKEPSSDAWTDITDTYINNFIAKENGIHLFRITNGAGVVSEVTSIELGNITDERPILDWTFDQVTRNGYVEGTWTNEPVGVAFMNKAAGMNITNYQFNIDGGTWKNISVNRDHIAKFNAIEGNHVYGMRLINDNNITSEEKFVNIRIDTEKPTFNVQTEVTEWTNGSVGIIVEASDAASGISDKAYSFDNGHTWVEDNKISQYVNKNFTVMVKDIAGNIDTQEVIIDKIDTLAPIMTSMKEDSQDNTLTRDITVKLEDYRDEFKNEGSGVEKAYVSNIYPYKDGKLREEKDMILLELDNESLEYKTTEPITALKDGKNDIYLVVSDKAGNMNVIESQISNMIGSQPSDKPNVPEDIIVKKEVIVNHYIDVVKKGDSSYTQKDKVNSTTSSTESIDNLKNQYDELEKQVNITKNNETKALTKVNNEKKAVTSYANKINNAKRNQTTMFIVGWVVVVIAAVYAIFLYIRYRNKKNRMEGGRDYE